MMLYKITAIKIFSVESLILYFTMYSVQFYLHIPIYILDVYDTGSI